MQPPITISTRRKTINFLLDFEQAKLFKHIANLKYLVTHRQLNRKMIQNKVIEYVNVEGVNIEKPFSNGRETTSWWNKFIYYVENNECKMKSHPYWENIAANMPISCELAYDEDGKYVLFEPLPSEDDVEEVAEPEVLKENTVVLYDQFKRTIPTIQVENRAFKRSRENDEEEPIYKKYKQINTECRYGLYCINEYCNFFHPYDFTPGPHNRKCKYSSNCKTLGCKFNHN